MRVVVAAFVVVVAVAVVLLTRRPTRPGSRLAIGPTRAATVSPTETVAGTSVARGWRVATSCLGVGAGCGLVVVVIPWILLLLITRGCEGEDLLFDVKVEHITATEMCLHLIDDGPEYVDRCTPAGEIEIVGLPTGIADGECLELRHVLDGDLDYLEYVGRIACP